MMPNSRELIKESINSSITLTKKLLLTYTSKKSRLSSGLIATAKKSPHLMSPLKLHNLSRKTILHTGHKNRTSPSILIKSSPVSTKLRLIQNPTIIIISKKHLLLSSSSLLWNHRLSRTGLSRLKNNRVEQSFRSNQSRGGSFQSITAGASATSDATADSTPIRKEATNGETMATRGWPPASTSTTTPIGAAARSRKQRRLHPTTRQIQSGKRATMRKTKEKNQSMPTNKRRFGWRKCNARSDG
jgi:hypothetical protein